MPKFIPPDVRDSLGCWGDGAFGHQHTRQACAATLRHYALENFESRGEATPGFDQDFGPMQLAEKLDGEMPDDAWDEDLAIEWLNEHAPFTGAYWGWCDGDFGLWPEEGDE
jgi:hypothetical protein